MALRYWKILQGVGRDIENKQKEERKKSRVASSNNHYGNQLHESVRRKEGFRTGENWENGIFGE